MGEQRNITSTLRRGFEYQDLLALKLCGEWIISPDTIKWLQIEANPTEDDEFYLDDVIFLDSDNKFHCHQAKFKQDQNYEWTWDDLLKSRKSKKNPELELPGLLKKWVDSLTQLGLDSIKMAKFTTNATFSSEIKAYLDDDGLLDITNIQSSIPETYDRIKALFNGQDADVIKFFSLFIFESENKHIDTIKGEIFDFYRDTLRATDDGIRKLHDFLRHEASQEFTNELDIEVIRENCGFDNPRPLNEQFEIPADFQTFDEERHASILKSLKKTKGGLKIIHGKPGSGKSVYLAHLTEELRKDESLLVVNHHYYINTSLEIDNKDRLNADRVIEAIKAQFKDKDNSQYLGELRYKYSKNIRLHEFITEVSHKLLEKSMNLIIVIDGLDHVIREYDLSELRKFLHEIFCPQPGLWILLGTQPQVRNEPSLSAIFSKKEEEIEIDGLSKDGVHKMLVKNQEELTLPDQATGLNDLNEKIYQLTEGNPLHLRYILRSLRIKEGSRLITSYSIEGIIPYGGDIVAYYSSLWKSLNHDTKTFLLVFVNIDFDFSYNQFIECLSTFKQLESSISEEFGNVEHLTIRNGRDTLRIFHDSFRLFLIDQPEFAEQMINIKSNIKEWLENSEHEGLKWAELRKLECMLGNHEPILEIDKNWLIEAIKFPRNYDHIISQMRLSRKIALDDHNYKHALMISHLETYLNNSSDEEAGNLIWIEAISLNPEVIDTLYLKGMSSEVLAIITAIADKIGKNDIIEEAHDIVIDRVNSHDRNERDSLNHSLLRILAYDRKMGNLKNIFNYVIQFRESGGSTALFSTYTQELLNLRQYTKLNKLLELELNGNEREAVVTECVYYDFKNSHNKNLATITQNSPDSLIAKIYLYLNGETVSISQQLPEIGDFPLKIKEYGEARGIWAEKFFEYFQIGLIFFLTGKEDEVFHWMSKLDGINNWALRATIQMFNIAFMISKNIKENGVIKFKSIYEPLDTVEDLIWHVDRDRIEFKYAFISGISRIIKEVIYINRFLKKDEKITLDEYRGMLSSPFITNEGLLNLILDLDDEIFDKEVFDLVILENSTLLSKEINTFPERAKEYAKLVHLCRIYSEYTNAKDLLNLAIDNSLGHGYHKDVYLFSVLESIEKYAVASDNKKLTDAWLRLIIPMIEHVTEYTDGDETHHLGKYLSEFLSNYNLALLFQSYVNKCKSEEFYDAEETFGYIVRGLSFENNEEIQLGSTALDRSSYPKLKEKALSSSGAKKSLDLIFNKYGELNYEEESRTSSYSINYKIEDYESVKPSELGNHLQTIETKWDIEKFTVGWFGYWVEKYDKEELYNILISTFLKENLGEDMPYEILDILYPLAYEFDNKRYFKLLCLAQKNGYGWSEYYTAEEKGLNRWRFIKDICPDRYIEFFEKSIKGGFPVKRGVEFFIFFGDLIKAQELIEASLDFSQGLMANLALPEFSLDLNAESNTSILDVLIERLIGPNPIIRESSASAIGELILSDSGQKTYEKLLSWLGSWEIESIIAIGLLPIIRAFQLSKRSNNLSFIQLDEICKSIKCGSMVIHELLNELSILTEKKIDSYPSFLMMKEGLAHEKSNNFFWKNIEQILPPIYRDVAESIENEYEIDFINAWIYNAQEIGLAHNIEFASHQDYYGHNSNGKFLTGLSTKTGEVFKSAFLRVLQNYEKFIQKDFYIEYSIRTLPIDLSLWKIKPGRMPTYWPKVSTLGTSDELNGIIDIDKSVESLLKYSANNYSILSASGAICPQNGWIDNPMHSFSLIAFGYKVIGKNIPNAEDIAKELLWNPEDIIIPTSVDRHISHLDESNHNDLRCEEFRLDDIIIFPLVSRNRFLVNSFWQFYRMKELMFNVTDYIRSDLHIFTNDTKWGYTDDLKKELVIFEDWIEGLKDRYEFKAPLPYGQSILIDQTFLENIKQQNDIRIGYLLVKKLIDRKYDYDEIKVINQFSILRVSPIII